MEKMRCDSCKQEFDSEFWPAVSQNGVFSIDAVATSGMFYLSGGTLRDWQPADLCPACIVAVLQQAINEDDTNAQPDEDESNYQRIVGEGVRQ